MGLGTVEKLREYLRALSPQARAMLLSALERAALNGEPVTGGDLIWQQLRHVAREQCQKVSQLDDSARLFFKPLEPFFVDDEPEHQHPGRIARASLETLWSWVRRGLLPEESKVLSDAVGAAMLAGAEAKAEELVHAFQDRVCTAIAAIFENAPPGEAISRRLAQIGTKRHDAETLRCVLANRPALGKLSIRLPTQIADLAGDQLYACKRLIEMTSAQDEALFLYSLLMVMSRLSAPWQIVRFGIMAAGTAVAARIAETPYGIAVTIAVAELERMINEVTNDLRAGVAVGSALSNINDAMRGLSSEIELPVASTWGRALATQRKKVSTLPLSIHGLRPAGPADRDSRKPQAEAALRFRAGAFSPERHLGKVAQAGIRGRLRA